MESVLTTNSMFDDVADFHKVVLGIPHTTTPTLVSAEFALERFRFLNEEVGEYLEAAHQGDMVAAVDGLLDTIYVALGTLYFMGVPVQECWDAVHKANMAKVRGITKRGNACDAVKPPDWVGPEAEIAVAIGKLIR